MDQRNTFKDLSQLLSLVSALKDKKEKASFIIDKNGLSRMEGIITAVEENAIINKTSVRLNPSNIVLLDQVIAVNGIFRSDYSEC